MGNVCAVTVAVAASPAISADKIKVGFVFSMTAGGFAYGASQKEGAQLAVDQTTPRPAAGCRWRRF
jgi:hypothetical protein